LVEPSCKVRERKSLKEKRMREDGDKEKSATWQGRKPPGTSINVLFTFMFSFLCSEYLFPSTIQTVTLNPNVLLLRSGTIGR
jgi:hypothetical protein